MRNAIASGLAVIAIAGCQQVDVQRDAASLAREVHLPGWIYAGAPYCPPAAAVGPGGEVVVTSNVIPTLWRIDPKTRAVTVHVLALNSDQDKDVGFARLAYARERGAYIAYSETQRSVWKIDASLKTAVKLADSEFPRSNACATH